MLKIRYMKYLEILAIYNCKSYILLNLSDLR